MFHLPVFLRHLPKDDHHLLVEHQVRVELGPSPHQQVETSSLDVVNLYEMIKKKKSELPWEKIEEKLLWKDYDKAGVIYFRYSSCLHSGGQYNSNPLPFGIGAFHSVIKQIEVPETLHFT